MLRVHRLDQINAKKPAKLLNSKSRTLCFSRQQIWPVFFRDTATWIDPVSCGAPPNPVSQASLSMGDSVRPGIEGHFAKQVPGRNPTPAGRIPVGSPHSESGSN